MHIEAGVVDGAKMFLAYGTAVVVFVASVKAAWDHIKDQGVSSLVLKSMIATLVVFFCFEVLPHQPIGVSEVHLILGTTIFLIFGLAPAAFGLALGLLVQGVFFAPFDLPQYGMNVTTLLASMFVLSVAAKKIIPANMAYKDISYTQMLKISLVWEGTIVAWVAFWAFYGQGLGVENMMNVLSFSGAYMAVVLVEPFIDMAILAMVKSMHKTESCLMLFDKRLCKAQS